MIRRVFNQVLVAIGFLCGNSLGEEIDWVIDPLKSFLQMGMDRNIVVFDGDNSKTKLSRRLVALMKVVMRRNHKHIDAEGKEHRGHGKLTTIYVCEDHYKLKRNKIFGVEIITISSQDYDKLREYYVGKGASFPKGTKELIIGLDESKGIVLNETYVLLGAI